MCKRVFQTAEHTANADALGTLRLLEALRISGMEKSVRFYQGIILKVVWQCAAATK